MDLKIIEKKGPEGDTEFEYLELEIVSRHGETFTIRVEEDIYSSAWLSIDREENGEIRNYLKDVAWGGAMIEKVTPGSILKD